MPHIWALWHAIRMVIDIDGSIKLFLGAIIVTHILEIRPVFVQIVKYNFLADSVMVDRFHSLIGIELPQNLISLSNHALSLTHGAERRWNSTV